MFTQFIRFLLTVLMSTEILASQIHRASEPPSTCDAIGTFCTDDCMKIFSCIETGQPPSSVECSAVNNGQHPFCKESDNKTATCSADSAVCTGKASVKILCGQLGEFPNPLDCAETVMCKGVNEEPFATCRCSGEGSINLDEVGLPCGNGPACSNTYHDLCPNGAGGTNTVGSSHYHYRCTDDGLMVYYIPNGKLLPEIIADTSEKICKESQQPSSSSSPSPSTDSPGTDPSNTDPTNPSDPTPSPTSNPVCSRVDEKFPDPDCCSCFYRCNKNLQLEHRKCPKTPTVTYFYEKTRTCVNGTCSDTMI